MLQYIFLISAVTVLFLITVITSKKKIMQALMGSPEIQRLNE